MRSATTIEGLLRDRARLHPARELLRCGVRTMAYGDVDDAADEVATRLRAGGLATGDRIAILADQTIEVWLLLFGAARAGVVPVLVNWRLSPPELSQIVGDAGSAMLLHTDRLGDLAGQVDFPGPREAVEAFVEPDRLGAGGDRPDLRSESPLPEDVVVQLYTSGTTGLPKGVCVTNSNMLSLIDLIDSELPGFASDGALLVAAPLFHIAGYGFAMSALEVGARMVLLPVFDPAEVVRLIESERPTHSLLVPAMLLAVSLVPGVDDHDFSSMRGVLYGGSPISVQLMARVRGLFGCRFTQAYGLTETTGLATMLRWDDHENGLAAADGSSERSRLASGGYPAPGCEVRVCDGDGEALSTREQGEVWIRSPLVTAGYWRRDAANEISFRDGWFRSGDIGFLDEDGYLYLVDRVNDIVVTGGENVFPGEVERVLGEHPAVIDLAVVGVPDEVYGESICAVLVTDRASELTVESVREFCRPHLANFKLPRRIEFVDELPKTPSGKVQRRLVREPFWEGHERRIH